MALHPIRVATATVDANINEASVTNTLREALVKRGALTLGPAESLGDITQATGEIALAVIHSATGAVYFYDETDSTTVDDGVTCLVDGSGHRYHLWDSASVLINSVLAETNTPAVGPTAGDAYIVGTAPTGAWSAEAKNIALYTRRGWVFATPSIGLTVLDQATGTNKQYSAAGSWGAFVAEIDDGSIDPVKLAFPMGLIVEEALNTPPGSPTADTYWRVGTVPTGAFVGHSNDIAYYEDATWKFIDPAEGATVFDKAAGFLMHWVGGSWLGGAGSDFQEFTTAGAATWTKPAKGTVAFVQLWGGGGSGGRAGADDGGGGGGGGGYAEWLFKLADLGATEAINVAAGGASRTSDNQNGQAGGNTTFGAHLTAFGGGGGCGNIGDGGGGGGGGGPDAAGADSTTQTGGNGGSVSSIAGGVGGTTGTVGADSQNGGAGGGGGNAGAAGGNGGNAIRGGGGGGGGKDNVSGSNAGNGGRSRFGGGGGGGCSGGGGGSQGSGGDSVFGGDGGAAATGSSNATAGSQPAGGGGGTEQGNSGKGGDGLCRVTVW